MATSSHELGLYDPTSPLLVVIALHHGKMATSFIARLLEKNRSQFPQELERLTLHGEPRTGFTICPKTSDLESLPATTIDCAHISKIMLGYAERKKLIEKKIQLAVIADLNLGLPDSSDTTGYAALLEALIGSGVTNLVYTGGLPALETLFMT